MEFLLEEKNNEMKNFLHCFHFYTIIARLPFLTSKTLFLFFFFWIFLIFECYLQLSIFLLIFYFEYFLLANTIPNLTYCFCFSTTDEFVYFHYAGEFLVRSKNRAVLTLINQPMQMLSSRGVLPNECLSNVQKLSRKYLWMNSFLTEM